MNITKESFIDEFNKVLEEFKIDYIIPTHDKIALFLTEHQNKINAKVVCSPYETSRIAENKKLTYEALKDSPFYPKVYKSADEVTKYPVFLKLFVGAGGKGTHLANNKDELEQILAKNSDLLVCEYLPGKEYTVDCFTNKDEVLLFTGPRKRERITLGIMKKILLLGGSTQQIPAIEYAKKQGYYTILCDYLPDNPGQHYADRFYCVSTTNREAILEVAQKEKVDGVVAYASDPAASTAAYVAEKMGLPTSPYKLVELLTNKDKFRAFFAEHNLCTPKAKGYGSIEEAKKDIGRFRLPVII